jgi:hypothetical protein
MISNVNASYPYDDVLWIDTEVDAAQNHVLKQVSVQVALPGYEV